MTDIPQNSDSPHASLAKAEETLRQLAKLAPPSGLEMRIHNRLAEPEAISDGRSFWTEWSFHSLFTPARRFQLAGAVLVIFALAGSTWSVYRSHPQPPVQSQVPVRPQEAPSKAESSGGFQSAGAERRPSTVAPIKIQPAPRKKPSASHAAKRLPRQADGAEVGNTAQAPQ